MARRTTLMTDDDDDNVNIVGSTYCYFFTIKNLIIIF